MVERLDALQTFLDCLTALTNATGVRCETVQAAMNGEQYWLKWETGKGYVIADKTAMVQP